MNEYESTSLWKSAFTHANDGLDNQRERIARSYREFRHKVIPLLEQIQKDLPSLTIHDITHVDSLWRVASEIAGPEYKINPVEALVLGGAFLLHDAAHCLAAYSGGIDDLRETNEWRDAMALRCYNEDDIADGSDKFKDILFDTLRVLHPKQARKLPFFKLPDGGYLLPDNELRDAYGDLIGEIAESHWSYPHELEKFSKRVLSAPVCLTPANWDVNTLKIALLLRVADAAHIDAKRAPKLLRTINKPQGTSKHHWDFQARLHQPSCKPNLEELFFTSNNFLSDEQEAWWLAFDTACLVDRELYEADRMFCHYQRENRFSAKQVAGVRSPEAFSEFVRTENWHPVNTSINISDMKSIVQRFGGEKLYGNKPYLALRELLQNARDAVMASRSLGALAEDEGTIDVVLVEREDGTYLEVTDTGIGMSRYVLTDILLDFGRSLWKDAALSNQWPGLPASKFKAVGQFGIGFFSVFMLGDSVKITTKRQTASQTENETEWVLEFPNGLSSRPILRQPKTSESLNRHGTKVSVLLKEKVELLNIGFPNTVFSIRHGFFPQDDVKITLKELVGALAPTLEINVYTEENNQPRTITVSANDWKKIDATDLLLRLAPAYKDKKYFTLDSKIISTMEDSDSTILGRCTIGDIRSGSKFGFSMGVVTVGGLYGGHINDLCGVLLGAEQKQLDRSNALPMVTATSLNTWVNEQIRLIKEKSSLTREKSLVLIRLGADDDDLPILIHNTGAISKKTFKKLVGTLNEILIVEKRYLTHNSNEDELTKYDFDQNFKLDSNTFGIDIISSNGFITEFNWPKSISENLPGSPHQIVENVLNQVWNDAEDEELDSVRIGTASGITINRPGVIIRKKTK